MEEHLKSFEDVTERQVFMSGNKTSSVYTNVGVRNDVILFIDSKGSVTLVELKDFINTKLAAKRGKKIDRTWIHKFSRYFSSRKSGKSYTFKLSPLGKKMASVIKRDRLG